MIGTRIPKHVAIIMDGNGRWAKKRHMPRTYGHLQGVRRVDDIVAAARIAGIQFLTLFAFSAENWNRPKQEVDMLMSTLAKNLDEKAKELHKADIKFQVLGCLDGAPEKVVAALSRAQEQTKNNTGMTLNL
ncbi:MAG TPA: polyprenyl diphosphate synthase, partial [Candidatus Omnitrophota bacterium]|nr:polyprenyl diphosphate synthase [Candidatus Omnitrophota bacterium]